MSEEEIVKDEEVEEVEPLYNDVFIGDSRYHCSSVDFGECPNIYGIEVDDKGIEHVVITGKDTSYQKVLNANGLNSNINYLLAKFMGGDPEIVECVESGLDFLSKESNGGQYDSALDDPMQVVENFFDSKNAIKANPLINEFLSSQNTDILEDKNVFFDKWDKFIASKKSSLEAELKSKEVTPNE